MFIRYFFSSRSGSLIRLVSWICLAGMTVSVAALILIVSIMGGFGKAITSRLLSREAHLVIHFTDKAFSEAVQVKNSVNSAVYGKNKKKSLFFDREEHPLVFSRLSQDQREGIRSALVFETQDLILKSADKFNAVSAVGYSKNQWNEKVMESLLWEESPQARENSFSIEERPLQFQKELPQVQEEASPAFLSEKSGLKKNSIPAKHKSALAKNTSLTKSALVKKLKEVLISYELSMAAGLFPGDELTLIPLSGLLLPPGLFPPAKTFTVKGILRDSETRKNPFVIYHQQGMMDFGDFSRMSYRSEIQLKNPEQAPFYQSLFSQYKTQTWMERNSTLFFALKLEKFVMTLFLILALLISCLGISSALFLLMTQKAGELAILRVVGLSQKEIVSIFTKVGFFLALLGITLGLLIGFAGTFFLKYNTLNFLPEIYQDRTIPARFMPFNYLLITFCALGLSWISCYLPTRYLSRIRIAHLLKTADP